MGGKKCCLYSLQAIVTWAGVTSLEPDWLVSQGWSVLGLRELVACGRQCTSKIDLEYLFPSVEPPTPQIQAGEIKSLELTYMHEYISNR